MAHLLRRAAFGARPDEISSYLAGGFEATVDQLLNYDDILENPGVPASPPLLGELDYPTLLGDYNVTDWWLTIMYRTRRPLRERMVLFWHDHFATSFDKVGPPNGGKHIYWQNQLERQHATGNFRDLMKAMDRDPAMLRWLDSNDNTKASPNENYARELMEVFMLGFEAYSAGVYAERDVQQAARAYTGWRLKSHFDIPTGSDVNGRELDQAKVIEIPPPADDGSVVASAHDYGEKTIFGVTGKFNGSDIVDLILDHEPQRTACAQMLGRKLFEYFVYENPDAQVVYDMGESLKRHDFNIKPFLRDMFLNNAEFYSLKALRSLPKSPAYFAVSTVRLLQLPEPYGEGTIAPLTDMGQQLFHPPDVFGWPGGADWFSSTRMLARMNWANTTVLSRSSSDGIPLTRLLGQAGLSGNVRPELVVDYFTALLIQGPLPQSIRQTLVEYLLKLDNGQLLPNFTLTNETIDKKVRGLIHLLLSRPEAQVF
jgi:uncharacterized protein (DUF1800 family)